MAAGCGARRVERGLLLSAHGACSETDARCWNLRGAPAPWRCDHDEVRAAELGVRQEHSARTPYGLRRLWCRRGAPARCARWSAARRRLRAQTPAPSHTAHRAVPGNARSTARPRWVTWRPNAPCRRRTALDQSLGVSRLRSVLADARAGNRGSGFCHTVTATCRFARDAPAATRASSKLGLRAEGQGFGQFEPRSLQVLDGLSGGAMSVEVCKVTVDRRGEHSQAGSRRVQHVNWFFFHSILDSRRARAAKSSRCGCGRSMSPPAARIEHLLGSSGKLNDDHLGQHRTRERADGQARPHRQAVLIWSARASAWSFQESGWSTHGELKTLASVLLKGPTIEAVLRRVRDSLPSYERKPRGGYIAEAGEAFGLRYSLCCGREGCRKRALPPSLRFLGGRVYLEAVVLLASALAMALKTLPLASEATSVPARTLRRWHGWWSWLPVLRRSRGLGAQLDRCWHQHGHGQASRSLGPTSAGGLRERVGALSGGASGEHTVG